MTSAPTGISALSAGALQYKNTTLPARSMESEMDTQAFVDDSREHRQRGVPEGPVDFRSLEGHQDSG